MRSPPPHLHCFLPLLVFMGTYSSFQSFLWITDAASRSCSLLCSLTITSLERLRFCVCKCNSCRGGCGSLQESVSRMWGLLATLPTLPLGYFNYRVNPVLPVPGANQLSNIMSTLARFSFVIFFFSSSSERPSFFKTRLTTQNLFMMTLKWVSHTFCRSWTLKIVISNKSETVIFSFHVNPGIWQLWVLGTTLWWEYQSNTAIH